MLLLFVQHYGIRVTTGLTFLGRAGGRGDFYPISFHSAVVGSIQEKYNRFPDVGQFAEPAQLCGILYAANSPRSNRSALDAGKEKEGYLLPILIYCVIFDWL